jgi:hypothetical protein
VAGVDLARLARTGEPIGAPAPAFLRAEAAGWNPALARVLPAELLVVAPDACRIDVLTWS